MKAALPALVAALLATAAGAEVFTHTDPGSGMTILSNVRPRAGPAAAQAPRGQPPGFPRVSSARQKQLDEGRRAILQHELAAEQSALAAASARKAAAEVLNRHVANVDALRRELKGVR